MYQIILMIHVFIAVCIVALVLIQQGKGATMGAAFGAGASSTVFGSRGSGSFLFRITVTFIGVFFITSIGLNYIAARAYKTEKVFMLSPTSLPAAPAPATSPATAPASQPAGNI
jgi:preprotein translocase subunit SecG